MSNDYRVKELGPASPLEGRGEMSPDVARGALSPQNSDLALLRTGNVSLQYSIV